MIAALFFAYCLQIIRAQTIVEKQWIGENLLLDGEVASFVLLHGKASATQFPTLLLTSDQGTRFLRVGTYV